MHIIASFEHSDSLEMVLSKLVRNGIPPESIIAVPLDRRIEEARVFDTIHRSNGKSLMDIAFIWGVIFMLLGTIYGFVLRWGPILWGLIGLISGLLFGFCIDYLLTKRSQRRRRIHIKKTTEVFVSIKCRTRDEMDMVEKLLWEHFALGIGRVESKG
jgi:hypothetical protein